jgi:hypothetical protein
MSSGSYGLHLKMELVVQGSLGFLVGGNAASLLFFLDVLGQL